jgi:hypothetical protein
LLDGHFDDEGRFGVDDENAQRLIGSALEKASSSPLGDAELLRDVRQEIQALGAGLGSLSGASTVGSYVGGLQGKWHDSLVELRFVGGRAYYRVEWDGNSVVSTSGRAPRFAAPTLVQPLSSVSLVGWNVITTKAFALTFDETFDAFAIRSGARVARATRVKEPHR